MTRKSGMIIFVIGLLYAYKQVLFIRICEDKGFMFNPEEDFLWESQKTLI